ncbi:MAG: ribosome maturation factor RimM [Bacilli bacterium]|jgi:16S rRNA processing protein RimM
MDKLSIGKIIATVGLRGEVKVIATSDFANQRFKKNQVVYLFDELNNLISESMIVASRKSNDKYYLHFAGIETIEQAEKIVGFFLLVAKDSKVLPKGFFYHDDLIGCQVVDKNTNQIIGIVIQVEEYPAHRTLRIQRQDGKDVLIPFVKFFIKDVKIETKTIVAYIIEGML